MTTRENSDEVLKVAVELHTAHEAQREAAREQSAVREAAEEVGIDARHVDEAEAEVARRRALAAAERARQSRILRYVGAAGAAMAIAFGAWRVTRPTPVMPWTEAFADHGRWSLDTSLGSVAHVRYETFEARSAAVVTVERALPRADGTWFVNLDGAGLPSLTDHHTLRVTLSGTLPAARVYLEAGTDERWRSPPIAVQPSWTTHRLALASFEHQRRREGRWQVVSAAAPSGITVVSLKLGHFVNDPSATGVVRVAEIRVE